MSEEAPIEIFTPPNVLKAKVGGSGGLDFNAVKRGEQALEELKCEFAGWLADDIAKLESACKAHQKVNSAATLATLYRAGHDLRGQATTFEFPVIARIATSLCKLTDESGPIGRIPFALIEAHVAAIKVVAREGIKDSKDKMAGVLAMELENKVDTFLAKNAAA